MSGVPAPEPIVREPAAPDRNPDAPTQDDRRATANKSRQQQQQFARDAAQIAPNTPPAEAAPQTVRDAEQTAATAPASQEGAAASVAVAAEVAEELGLRPNESVTPAQIDRAGAAYEQQYRADVVPRMVDFYMRNGMFEEANAFIEVVESVNGQMAMRELGKATFAATIGDFDGAANGMLSAFKAYGIVDPGMTIDEEQTGVVRDDNGQPVGGKIVMVDPRTGNTFEQSFDSIDEFVTYGHMMLQPQTIAETLLERRANTQEMGTVSEIEKLVLQEATKLVDASSVSPNPLTMEEAIQQVTQSLNAVRGSGSLGELGASQGQPMRIPTSPEGITRF
jgi:cell division protein FtsN